MVRKISSNDAALYLNLGHVLIKLGRFYDSSKSLKQAIKLKPDLAEAYLALVDILRQLGKIKDAIFINGNTGDFISGGHIPIIAKKWGSKVYKKDILNTIFKSYINKH